MSAAAVDWRSVRWVLAGIAMADGEVDRLLSAGQWPAPESVSVDGDLIVCRQGGEWCGQSDGMLDAFLGLAEGEAEDVATFVRMWGSLVPSFWHLRGLAARWVTATGEVGPDGVCEVTEPLEDWRALAEHFRVVLDLAAVAHAAGSVDDALLAALQTWPLRRMQHAEGLDDDGAQLLRRLCIRRADSGEVGATAELTAASILDVWLRLAPAEVRFQWVDDEPRLELAPTCVVSALVLKLALAVTRVNGLATCSECGRAYIPKRAPRADQRRYCPNCGIRAAWRNAQRRRKGSE